MGKVTAGRARQRKRKWREKRFSRNGTTKTIYDGGSASVSLNRESAAVIESQHDLFVETFGREPDGDDPIFFDPDNTENGPREIQIGDQVGEWSAVCDVAAEKFPGLPHCAHAMRLTERMVTTDTTVLLSNFENAEWDAAADDFYNPGAYDAFLGDNPGYALHLLKRLNWRRVGMERPPGCENTNHQA